MIPRLVSTPATLCSLLHVCLQVSRTALAVAAIMGLGLMAAALLISNSSLQVRILAGLPALGEQS